MNDPAANFNPRVDTREDAPAATACDCCARVLHLANGVCDQCWRFCHDGRPCEHTNVPAMALFAEEAVEDWTDVDGFVVVDGQRVKGGQGVERVPVKRTCQTTCQGPCHRLNVTWPLSLYRRFEPGLDRDMYWFQAAASWDELLHVCTECAQRQVAS